MSDQGRAIVQARKLASDLGLHLAQERPGKVSGWTVKDADGRRYFGPRTVIECRGWLLGVSWMMVAPVALTDRMRDSEARPVIARDLQKTTP